MPREDYDYLPLRSVIFPLSRANAIVFDISIPRIAVEVRQ